MPKTEKQPALIAFGSNMGDSQEVYAQVQIEIAKVMKLIAASEPVKNVPVGSHCDNSEGNKAYPQCSPSGGSQSGAP